MAVKLVLVAVAVASPFPVTVTCAVAVAVDVPGAYCTLMVQFAPGFKTVVKVQLPPEVMEKVPPAPPTFAMVGAAVKVNAPAVAPAEVLVTVTEPVLVVVFPGVVVRVGLANAIVAPVTENVTGAVVVPAAVPIGVVAVTFLVVSPAPRAIAHDAFTAVAVGVPVIVQVTLPPRLTAVAPVRAVPLTVTGTVVPRTPLVGVIEVSVGPTTVNVTGAGDVVFPAAVTTPMV